MDLSTGEWQRLALGRTSMRDGPLVLTLDEPTASLDAHTEYELFDRFACLAADRRERGSITLLVSHRFSTVRMADWIVVLDRGRVAEQGTHPDLLASRGIYAELFALQASPYLDGRAETSDG